MDSALYASMHVLDVDECNMPYICDNVSTSDDPHDCDAVLHESLGVVDIPNIKLFKKNGKKFRKNLSKLFCENDDLIAKLNESNKLVKKYKNLAENSLEQLKEFECLNMDLDTKLVDDLKYKNKSLKMHAKCLIVEPISKKDENISCSHVVIPNFVPIVCSTLKDKSVYISPHKRNQKVERKAVKSKPLFRSQPKVLDGSKFVPTCHHCGVIGHIRPQCHKLKRDKTMLLDPFPKSLVDLNTLFVTIVVPLVILELNALSFMLLKESKEKRNLSFLKVMLKRVNRF